MDITTLLLLGFIPAGLILLAGMLVLYASESEVKGRNLFLYLLAVGALCLLVIGLAALLTPREDNRPLSIMVNLLTPSLVGVLALILIHLGELPKLRGRALYLAILLISITAALGVLLGAHPFGIFFYILPGALILALTWMMLRGKGGLVFALGLIAFVLISTLDISNLFASPFLEALPTWLRTPVGYLLSFLPGIIVAIAAALIFTAINRVIPDEERVGGEPAPSSHLLAYLQLILAGLLLGVLAYRIYWFSIWDQTSDGLSGLVYSMLTSLVAIGAGMVMSMRSSGRARLSGAAFAILVPLLVFGAFRRGWDVDYHEITEARAARLQAALERFHQANGHYPADLAELAPREIRVIPQPVIFEGEGWCYQGEVDAYRLGAVYREFFSMPLSIKIYASAGELENDSWECTHRLAELQALYEPAPFYEQEIHVPAEVLLPTSQVPAGGEVLEPVIQGKFLRQGGWSPDGRYLPVSQVVPSEGGYFAKLSFLDAETGQVCQVEEHFPLEPNPWGLEPRGYYAWSPTGAFIYLTPLGDIVELRPCRGDAAHPLESELAPFEQIAAYNVDSGRALLQTSAAYWIMEAGSMAIKQVEGITPNQQELHWDNYAWSPTGERLAISHLESGGESDGSTLYVLLGETGELEQSITLGPAHEQSAPWIGWLSDRELVISAPEELLLLDLDDPSQDFTDVIKDIFDLDLAYPDEIAGWSSVTGESGEPFHLALRVNHPRDQALYLYHSETSAVDVLQPQVHAFLIFPDGQSLDMPRFSFEAGYPDEYEVYWIDQPGLTPILLTPQGHTPRSYPRLDVSYLPGREQLVFSSSQGVSLVSLPEGQLIEFWRLSGEGHADVRVGMNEGALVAVRDRVDEADVFYISLPGP